MLELFKLLLVALSAAARLGEGIEQGLMGLLVPLLVTALAPPDEASHPGVAGLALQMIQRLAGGPSAGVDCLPWTVFWGMGGGGGGWTQQLAGACVQVFTAMGSEALPSAWAQGAMYVLQRYNGDALNMQLQRTGDATTMHQQHNANASTVHQQWNTGTHQCTRPVAC